MSLLVIGLNHRSAPVEIRERLALSAEQLPAALEELKRTPGVQELVFLSTCNRSEVYVHGDGSDALRERLMTALSKTAKLDDFRNHLYHRENAEGAKHLFRVAAGLDSMVVGEHEILGQVKQAYTTAQQSGMTGKLLNVLFQRSLFVGKKVRTDTGLSLGAASIGSVAVMMAERIFGDLRDNTAMIIGAGKMAELTARHLLSQKVSSILVCNRTFERAQELAAQINGRALPYEEGLRALAETDIVICSTSATEPIITEDLVRGVMQRKNGLLFFIDIGVPRNVHPNVHGIDNVYVYNIDDLQSIIGENLTKRKEEILLAEKIIDTVSDEFGQWLRAFLAGEAHSFRHTRKAVPE